MPLRIQCTGCSKQLQIPDQHAGGKVRCPNCQTVLQVAEASAVSSISSLSSVQPVASQQWYLKLEDGTDYGPVERTELDQWLTEGRITARCQLLSKGSQQWVWAGDVYPQLSGEAAESSGIDVAGSPAPHGGSPSHIGVGGHSGIGSNVGIGGSQIGSQISPHSGIGSASHIGTRSSRGSGKKKSTRKQREKVKGPAITLMVVSSLSILASIGGLFAGLAAATAIANDTAYREKMIALEQDPAALPRTLRTIYVTSAIFAVALNAFLIYAALSMKNLQSYGMAMTAGILSLLSCFPIGIWTIVVLNAPDVREAFRHNQGRFRR